jgi:hypothetical protein
MLVMFCNRSELYAAYFQGKVMKPGKKQPTGRLNVLEYVTDRDKKVKSSTYLTN